MHHARTSARVEAFEITRTHGRCYIVCVLFILMILIETLLLLSSSARAIQSLPPCIVTMNIRIAQGLVTIKMKHTRSMNVFPDILILVQVLFSPWLRQTFPVRECSTCVVLDYARRLLSTDVSSRIARLYGHDKIHIFKEKKRKQKRSK